MSLEAIKHNKAVIGQLKNVVSEATVSHAYLFVGEAVVRTELGVEFAKAILCNESPDDSCDACIVCRKINHRNHEDIIFVDKDGSSIKTEAIEKLIASISYKPIGTRTIIIMDHADAMTLSAQNKLLKTLEEPVGNAIIILLAERKNALKDTVISRCVSFYLQEGDVLYDGPLSDIALNFIKLCAYGDTYYKKRDALGDILSDPTVCLSFLDILEEKFRALLLMKAGAHILLSQKDRMADLDKIPQIDIHFIQAAVHTLEDTRKAIQQNYNTSYALKGMCLRIDSRKFMEE